MEAFADDAITDICCKCSAQSGKTETMFALLCWAIAENPGPILWVAADENEARKLMLGRLGETMANCEPVREKMPVDRQKKTQKNVFFYGAPFICAGSRSPQALQSTPFKFLILDEVRSYPKGALEMVFKRTRSFANHGYKRCIISTPGLEGDGVEVAYENGDQRVWYTVCDKCGHEHQLEWGDKDSVGGLKWDCTEETKPDGKWNLNKTLPTVRYECWNPECDRKWQDTARDRRDLRASGYWKVLNPTADATSRSYHWNALLPSWTNWKDQVKEFLIADAQLDEGDPIKMRDHITETRGIHWSDEFIMAKERKSISSVVEPYDPAEIWKDEVRRFMTVDVQEKGGRHYYYVVRAWGYSAHARLLSYGKVNSIEEIIQIQRNWNVPDSSMVFDSGGEAATDVYQWVIESGHAWKAMKGEDKDFFNFEGTRYLYSSSSIAPAVGRKRQTKAAAARVRLYLYAKYGCLDRLDGLAKGRLGHWRCHSKTDEVYMRSVMAYRRSNKQDKAWQRKRWVQRSQHDHFASCEIMQIAAADVCCLLDPAPVEQEA